MWIWMGEFSTRASLPAGAAEHAKANGGAIRPFRAFPAPPPRATGGAGCADGAAVLASFHSREYRKQRSTPSHARRGLPSRWLSQLGFHVAEDLPQPHGKHTRTHAHTVARAPPSQFNAAVRRRWSRFLVSSVVYSGERAQLTARGGQRVKQVGICLSASASVCACVCLSLGMGGTGCSRQPPQPLPTCRGLTAMYPYTPALR
eukprot:COSAG03_NODE_277_length_9517_cov_112.780739_7_plen_203_part_00